MGLDITLIRLQAYRTSQEIVITASQFFPIPDVEEFTVAPVRSRRDRADGFPEIPWDDESLEQFREQVTNATVLSAMHLCSSSPEEWISIRDIEAHSGRTRAETRADLAGLTMMVKRRFGRSNWPFDVQWAAGGDENAYYRMTSEISRIWTQGSARLASEGLRPSADLHRLRADHAATDDLSDD
jgi:hypothetical protein